MDISTAWPCPRQEERRCYRPHSSVFDQLSKRGQTPMNIDTAVVSVDLLPAIRRMWEVSGAKIVSIDRTMDRSKGAPVHTVAGQYRPRGWTDWTQGFEFGSAILQFDATGDQQYLALG